MEYSGNGNSDVDSWKEVILVYSSALKEIGTKLEILNDEFQHVHRYNPIEHIKSRIKTSESIVKKLKKHGYESTIDNMIQYVNDIAGIRIICSFTTDIYRIAEMLERQNDMNIISVKDYIKIPRQAATKVIICWYLYRFICQKKGRYKSRDTDKNCRNGFLGKPGTQN